MHHEDAAFGGLVRFEQADEATRPEIGFHEVTRKIRDAEASPGRLVDAEESPARLVDADVSTAAPSADRIGVPGDIPAVVVEKGDSPATTAREPRESLGAGTSAGVVP